MKIAEALKSEKGKWLRVESYREDFERVLLYENNKFIVIEYGQPSKTIIETESEEEAVNELLK